MAGNLQDLMDIFVAYDLILCAKESLPIVQNLHSIYPGCNTLIDWYFDDILVFQNSIKSINVGFLSFKRYKADLIPPACNDIGPDTLWNLPDHFQDLFLFNFRIPQSYNFPRQTLSFLNSYIDIPPWSVQERADCLSNF